MAQQTINVGTAPNDGTGTPLRTAFQYTNSNFSELYTAVGPSGNNIVVPGNATITGDLTVATSALKVVSASNRVLINQASAIQGDSLEVSAKSNAGTISLFGRASDNMSIVAFRANGATTQKASIQGSDAGFQFITGSTTRYTIDSTGIATWSDVGGVAGTAMTLNATGLGVGVSPDQKFCVLVADSAQAASFRAASGRLRIRPYINAAYGSAIQATNVAESALQLLTLEGYSVNLNTNVGTAMTLDSSGNVGIGVTPSAWGFAGQINVGGGSGLYSKANGSYVGSNTYYNGAWRYASAGFASYYYQYNGTHQWWKADSGAAVGDVLINHTQAMTLDASGNLLVGRTTQPYGVGNARSVFSYTGTGFYGAAFSNSTSGNGTAVIFTNSTGGLAGFIDTTNTTVTYGSVSDYRLKEQVQPLIGGLARVSALKPSIYKWKSDGSSGEGFLAHELAEVVPFAVSGEKDAVSEDGSIKPQGVDLSKVVPVLVAAIQELTARVQTLETR